MAGWLPRQRALFETTSPNQQTESLARSCFLNVDVLKDNTREFPAVFVATTLTQLLPSPKKTGSSNKLISCEQIFSWGTWLEWSKNVITACMWWMLNTLCLLTARCTLKQANVDSWSRAGSLEERAVLVGLCCSFYCNLTFLCLLFECISLKHTFEYSFFEKLVICTQIRVNRLCGR